MFRTSYRLPFRLSGIPLYIHISFLFILPLMVWATAQNLTIIVSRANLGLDPETFRGPIALLLGLISALGLFVCIVLHELGHALTAIRYGVKVRRITLWFLGGIAEFEEMPRQRGAEAIVAIAGPIVSFALAGLFWLITAIVPHATAPSLWLVCYYLYKINLVLGLFNLIPALPLDGGRILRSLLALRMPHSRATRISGNIAKVLAIGLGIAGIFYNVWFIVLAFFIFTAVDSETRYSLIVDLLSDLHVGDLMNRDVTVVPASMTVGELSRFILSQRHHSFPVVDHQGRLLGIVGVEQMQNVDPRVPVGQIMSTDVPTISQNASAHDAFIKMGQKDFGRIIVTDDNGYMVGIITKADLMRAIQVRMLGFQVADGQSPAFTQRSAQPYSPAPAVGYTRENADRDTQRYARPL